MAIGLGEVGNPVLSMVAWLEALVAARGSDLHLKVGSPPRMRVDGKLIVVDGPTITPEMAETLLREVIRPDLYDEFQKRNEADFGYSLSGVGRPERRQIERLQLAVHANLRRRLRGQMQVGSVDLDERL